MYGMQSKAGYGSGMGSGIMSQTRGYGSGMGSGSLSRGYANRNRFGLENKGGLASDGFLSEKKDSSSYSTGQQGRFSDYSDYGVYGDGYGGYGADKSAKNLGYGYGAQSYGSYASGYGKQCPGISIALLLISLLGIVLMGYILWSKIVAAGRRKRDVADMADFWWFMDHLGPIMINGRYC